MQHSVCVSSLCPCLRRRLCARSHHTCRHLALPRSYSLSSWSTHCMSVSESLYLCCVGARVRVPRSSPQRQSVIAEHTTKNPEARCSMQGLRLSLIDQARVSSPRFPDHPQNGEGVRIGVFSCSPNYTLIFQNPDHFPQNGNEIFRIGVFPSRRTPSRRPWPTSTRRPPRRPPAHPPPPPPLRPSPSARRSAAARRGDRGRPWSRPAPAIPTARHRGWR